MTLICAVLALAVTLWLGLSDYETTSVAQLATWENAPFMLAAFCVLFLVFRSVAGLGRLGWRAMSMSKPT